MKKIVGSAQMKAIDTYTIEKMGIPSCVLMERASLAVADVMEKNCPQGKILVVCGSGNNGGDGIAIARILHLRGFEVDVFLAGNPEKMTEETKLQYKIAHNYRVSFVNNIHWSEYTTIVDAIFGVGLAREIEGKYRELVEAMNQAEAYKVAVDIPSGIHGDTGAVLGIAFRADVTVTFAYRKAGLCLYPGRMYAGKVICADIGIYAEECSENCTVNCTDNDTENCIKYCAENCAPGMYALESDDLKLLPERLPYGNKGTFGKVLVVAGSKGMCGAAYLSAAGALAAGCGMVKIVTSQENRIPLQTSLPEAMVSCDFSEEENIRNLNWCDVLVLGPGVGTAKEAEEHIRWYLKHASKAAKTVILDADGLNLLAVNPDWKACLPKNLIVTPHLGEMSRLSGRSIRELQSNPVQMAGKFAAEWNLVCVMKDACTVIADENGMVYLNLSGNSGMACAGSGDVLSGILAAVCCMFQGAKNHAEESVSLCQQAALGVMLHGCAGDEAAKSKGMHSMTARSIVEHLWKVLHKVS